MFWKSCFLRAFPEKLGGCSVAHLFHMFLDLSVWCTFSRLTFPFTAVPPFNQKDGKTKGVKQEASMVSAMIVP